MEKCKYCIFVTQLKENICLFYHDMLIRNDGLEWGPFPQCCEDVCPLIHTELWQEEAQLKQ